MKEKWMSIGFDKELEPYQEPKRDLSDAALLGMNMTYIVISK